MRAMILAAGLGTRMRPLSDHRAKPAMPVRGRPVIAWLLELLSHHGVDEVMINLHYLPDTVRRAVEEYAPEGLRIEYSEEPEPLGTGGGMRRAATFLRESDPCLVLAGDMLLDVDLPALVRRHRDTEALCTLLLRDDPRRESFGSIGLDAEGCVRRIASRFDLGGELRAGVFVGLRVFSPAVFESMPDIDCFEDLSDWLAPELALGSRAIRGQLMSPEDCFWEPVGTPQEYLRANLRSFAPRFISPTRLVPAGTYLRGDQADVIIGRGARLADGVSLRRCVVWDGEEIPENFSGAAGVFAGGTFYDCEDQEPPGER
jgi:NDP-sugar pyrophosphorylase family protein